MSDALKLENQLCHRFYTVSNAFSRAYRPLLKSLDITYPQYVVLMALWEQDDIPISELLRRTRIDGGAMTLILRKLQDKGYLDLVADPHDKRSRRVKLTKGGSDARVQAESIPHQMVCNLNSLTADEAVQLRDLIDKLSDCLDKSVCEFE
ncbi:MarR family winged helix-turn-helix transcriptional regulator [Alteromonas antoniana]|uniref:MarR family winged helix-turn-helix transcriptional regulator n=1 Tax=Alteromonas antoniana TaxID=2803813 RepID=UPI001C4403E7|nr:MarR family transcriptional regulator [Alteromonas antoniana]